MESYKPVYFLNWLDANVYLGNSISKKLRIVVTNKKIIDRTFEGLGVKRSAAIYEN